MISDTGMVPVAGSQGTIRKNGVSEMDYPYEVIGYNKGNSIIFRGPTYYKDCRDDACTFVNLISQSSGSMIRYLDRIEVRNKETGRTECSLHVEVNLVGLNG